MERIVSLLPSLTEIVCALGLRDALVGRSHECDHPADVAALPALTAPKLRTDGDSREIDRDVKALVRDGLSVYRVDAERLAALAPDWILTQDQCAVCAASLADVEAALAELSASAPRVLSLAPRDLADVWRQIDRIAAALGVAGAGAALRARLTERVSCVGERAAAAGTRPRVACIEWLEPLMAAGNWMPELVALAGGESLFGAPGAHSPWLDWDALRAADPDVLAVMPCGFDLARTRAEIHWLTGRPGFRELAAVRRGRVYLADGNAYFNRSGPRLADSLELLAELLHPERFDFGRRGVAYEAL